jgi:oligosaccharyl transferase (archaeosortase A-associated)
MKLTGTSKYHLILIGLTITLLIIFVLWIRLLPVTNLISNTNFLLGEEPDIAYNLRLIEQMLVNYPGYPSFDAMTLYPYGSFVFWGPVFTFIVTTACILTGASTQLDIVSIASLIPPILAAIMVPVAYYFGRFLHDWKTGLISALFIAIVSGQFLYRSLFGFVDHHIAEVLFSTVFILAYIGTLIYFRNNPVDISNFSTLKKPILLSAIVGITYLIALYTMPTIIVFALIAAIFTLIQFIWENLRKRKSDYLLILNGITFGIAIVGMLVIGLNDYTINLISYSPAHIIAYLAIILGTAYLFILSRYLQKSTLYLGAIGATIAIGILVAFFALPFIYSSFIAGIVQFFGTQATTLTVQEARPWSLGEAWSTFNFGLVLAIGGLLLLLYRNYKEERPDHVFVIVWSLVILYAAFQHVRYEYYLGPVIAILGAFFTGMVISAGYPEVQKFLFKGRKTVPKEEEKTPLKRKGGKAEKKAALKSTYDGPKVIAFFLVAAIAVLFVGMSAEYDYLAGNTLGYNTMHPDWRETLEWMETHTPDPGVDYDTIYNRDTFQYPPQSYGVMSWWDYGHWITFFAHRIPHANPFQAGVAGEYGAAAFFMVPTEGQVTAIADHLGTKYVVTDIEMDTGKFWAMATWYNDTLGAAPYSDVFLVTSPENPLSYQVVTVNTQNYYDTTISRLHNFDGSMTDPTTVYYVVYADGTQQTNYYPVITQAQATDADTAIQMAKTYNANASTGYHATVVSNSYLNPIERVPALRHFRLIYESATDAPLGENRAVKYVKAFEYVSGAHIKGEGIIAIDLVTNQGRTFTYRQESVNGEFIVPYSTEGNQYEVQALGKYHIEETNQEFSVTEEAVQNGLSVN